MEKVCIFYKCHLSYNKLQLKKFLFSAYYVFVRRFQFQTLIVLTSLTETVLYNFGHRYSANRGRRQVLCLNIINHYENWYFTLSGLFRDEKCFAAIPQEF